MDIAALSMALSHSDVRQQATLSTMNKAMEQTEISSQGLIKMMEQSSLQALEQSVAPHLGNAINIKV